MKIKTSELSGMALNYAVAIACDYKCALETPENGPDEWIVMGREMMWLERNPDWFDVWSPSTDWSQGGPLIERFKLCLMQTYSYDASQRQRIGTAELQSRVQSRGIQEARRC